MTQKYEVIAEALTVHAAEVDCIADQVAQATARDYAAVDEANELALQRAGQVR